MFVYELFGFELESESSHIGAPRSAIDISGKERCWEKSFFSDLHNQGDFQKNISLLTGNYKFSPNSKNSKFAVLCYFLKIKENH